MPLHQYVDSGGEFLLPFAKRKIREMHDYMAEAGLRFFNKTIITDTSSTIYLNSFLAGHGVFDDTIRITESGGSYLVGVTMPDPTPFRSLFILDGNFFSFASWTHLVYAITSDEIIIGSVPQVLLSDNQLNPVFATLYWSGGNQYLIFYWAVDGSNRSTFVGAFTTTLEFTSPSDVSNVFGGGPNGGASALPAPWQGYEYNQTDPALVAAWAADYALGVAREKTRLQSNSTIALNLLRANVLPPTLGIRGSWSHTIKQNALVSTRPRTVSAFTASGPAVGAVINTPGTTVETRTVICSYTDADGNIQQETVTGTRTQVGVNCTRGGGGIYGLSNPYLLITTTYVNFPIFDTTTGDYATTIPGASYDSPHRDGSGNPLGSIVDGVVVTSAICANSALGSPSIPSRAGNDYTPAIPFASSTATVRCVQLYLNYLAAIKPVDFSTLTVDPGYSSNWLSTSMVPGETVVIVPFAPVLAGEDLGMFGPTAGATQVATYGYASFRYNADGTFTNGQWRENPQVTNMLDSAGSAITWPGTNCVVKYTQFGWKDTQTTAATQAATLKAPVTNGDKFLALIKQAQGI